MSLLKADTIKPVTSGGDLSLQGDSGGSAVDCLNITSAGDINFTGNTDAKIKLPSAGGIYESDGSTAVLTESGATVTLDNVTLGSSVTGSSAKTSFARVWHQETDGTNATHYDSASNDSVAGRRIVKVTSEQDEDGIVSLVSSYKMLLVAGEYWIHWRTPSQGAGRFTSTLYRVDPSAGDVAYGSSEGHNLYNEWSEGWYHQELRTAVYTYEVDIIAENGGVANGCGADANRGQPEIYLQVEIFKIA